MFSKIKKDKKYDFNRIIKKNLSPVPQNSRGERNGKGVYCRACIGLPGLSATEESVRTGLGLQGGMVKRRCYHSPSISHFATWKPRS